MCALKELHNYTSQAKSNTYRCFEELQNDKTFPKA